MVKTFKWTLTKRGFLKSSMDLFLDGVLFGTITDRSFKTPTEINGRKFVIRLDKSFISYPKSHQLIDFESKKVICDIEYHSKERQVFAVFSNKLKYEVSPGTGNPSQTNGQVIQQYRDTLWFAESGKLEVRTDKNIEALIVCFFFAHYIDSD